MFGEYEAIVRGVVIGVVRDRRLARDVRRIVHPAQHEIRVVVEDLIGVVVGYSSGERDRQPPPPLVVLGPRLDLARNDIRSSEHKWGCQVCVTEAAIDAMSLATIEGVRDGTLYLSTGGGWSPTTEAALRRLASRPGAQLVAATDANPQGARFAKRLREVAADVGCGWSRLRPRAEDWNER